MKRSCPAFFLMRAVILQVYLSPNGKHRPDLQLVERPILGPRLRPPKWEMQEWDPRTSRFHRPSRWLWHMLKFENHWLRWIQRGNVPDWGWRFRSAGSGTPPPRPPLCGRVEKGGSEGFLQFCFLLPALLWASGIKKVSIIVWAEKCFKAGWQ